MTHYFSQVSRVVSAKLLFCIFFLSIKTFAFAFQDALEPLQNKESQIALPLKYKMVGYLESWGNIGIEEAIAQNYNILVTSRQKLSILKEFPNFL